MRYSRLCRRLRESAVAPGVSLSSTLGYSYASLSRASHGCRDMMFPLSGGVAFALPSVIASVKLRGAKGSYAMLSRATHEA